MGKNILICLVIISALMFTFMIACSGDDDSEVGGISTADDDDDDSGNDDDDDDATNECGEYGAAQGCSDLSDPECESAYLANMDRAGFPEESDCAPNLIYSDELAAVALAHSKDMCDRDFWDHENPDGKDPFDRMGDAGISFVYAAENLAKGTGLSMEEANNMWMDEPECTHNHRSNLLSRKITHIGVGVYNCPDGWVYITQDFATFSYDDIPDNSHPYCGGDF